MTKQLALLDSCIRVDAEHWEIYEEEKLIGTFESNRQLLSFRLLFRSCGRRNWEHLWKSLYRVFHERMRGRNA